MPPRRPSKKTAKKIAKRNNKSSTNATINKHTLDAKKVDNVVELINLCKKLMTICNSFPYSTMDPRERYQELYEINKVFAQSHPVVYKMITEERKYNTQAFKKYLTKYNKTMITPEKQPELGSYYMMYLEMFRNKNKGHNMKEFFRYKADCQKQMEDDMERVKNIQKEEGDKYDKKEEERLEENKRELFQFFAKLNELKKKVDEYKEQHGMTDDSDTDAQSDISNPPSEPLDDNVEWV
jgi:hypothetical protein